MRPYLGHVKYIEGRISDVVWMYNLYHYIPSRKVSHVNCLAHVEKMFIGIRARKYRPFGVGQIVCTLLSQEMYADVVQRSIGLGQ